jgi:hypothetical protein
MTRKPTKPTPTRIHMFLFEPDLWRALKVIAAQEETTVSAIIRRQAERFVRRHQRRLRKGTLPAGVALLLALSTSACATGSLTLTREARTLPVQVGCDLAMLTDPVGYATLALCSASLLQQQLGCRRTP